MMKLDDEFLISPQTMSFVDLPLDLLPPASRERLDARETVAAADVLLEAAELRAQLLAAVAALAPRQRAIVVLRFYGDCSHAEIGRALGCRTGTVRATVHPAMRRLRAAGAGDMAGNAPRLPDRDGAPLTLERGDPTYEG